MPILDRRKDRFIDDQDKRVSVVIYFPLARVVGDDGYFKTTKTTVESIKNNIKLLLQTEQGERLFQPALGMNLRSVLFNQITEDSRIEIENIIVDTFNTWLPFVELRQIDVDTGRQDQNQIKINITFNIKRAPNSLNSVQVTFDGVGGGDITTTETTGGTTTTAGAY